MTQRGPNCSRRGLGAVAAVVLLVAIPAPVLAQAGVGFVDEVESVSYIAHGTAREGFEQFITLVNIADERADVEVRFRAEDDARNFVLIPSMRFDLLPGMRATGGVSAHLETHNVRTPVNFSMRIQAEKEVVAERVSYFRTSLAGGVSGATSLVGVPEPLETQFFAEGSVGPSAQELLTAWYPVVDDDDVDEPDATMRIRLFVTGSDGSARVVEERLQLTYGDRQTLDVNEVLTRAGVGLPAQVSVATESDQLVLFERTMYSKDGTSQGGSASVGVEEAATRWHLASTGGPGATTRVTVFNPGAGDARVTVRYGDGRGRPDLVETAPARDRAVFDDVATEPDTGLLVTADRDVVVERTKVVDRSIQTTMAHSFLAREQTFPDGRVGPDFSYDLVVYNPEMEPTPVSLVFAVTDDGGEVIPVGDLRFDVGPQAVTTTDIRAHVLETVGAGPVNVTVRMEARERVVAERRGSVRTDLAGGLSTVMVANPHFFREPDPLNRLLLGFGAAVMALMVVMATVLVIRRQPEQEAVADAPTDPLDQLAAAAASQVDDTSEISARS